MVILDLEKARSCRTLNLDCKGAELPGWFDVFPKDYRRHNSWGGTLSRWSCNQSPGAHSWGFLNYPNSFCRGMFKLIAEFHAGSLLYSHNHFECDGHTVHMLNQWRLPPPLTSAVKLSLFMHAHSSPVSLAARLHQCHVHCSHYIRLFLDRPCIL